MPEDLIFEEMSWILIKWFYFYYFSNIYQIFFF